MRTTMKVFGVLLVVSFLALFGVGCSDDDSSGGAASSGNSVSSSSGNSSISVPATFEEDMSLSQAIRDYYRNAYGKSGAALKTALTTIISTGYTDNGYGGLWTTYQTSDVTPAGKIWDLYSNTDLNGTGATASYWFTPVTSQCGTYGGESDCYNREHMIPQSKFSELSPMVSDAHFITATDGKVNGQRSNYPHGNVATASWTSQNGGKLGSGTVAQGYTGTCFEPVAAAKGDIARMYFYFSVRYAGNANCEAWESMGAGATMVAWAQNLYVDWSTADAVSQKERTRNQAIYARQGNRNPFIDYPVLVYMLFGTGSGTPASSSSSTSGDASSSAVASSSGASSSAAVAKTLPYSLEVGVSCADDATEVPALFNNDGWDNEGTAIINYSGGTSPANGGNIAKSATAFLRSPLLETGAVSVYIKVRAGSTTGPYTFTIAGSADDVTYGTAASFQTSGSQAYSTHTFTSAEMSDIATYKYFKIFGSAGSRLAVATFTVSK